VEPTQEAPRITVTLAEETLMVMMVFPNREPICIWEQKQLSQFMMDLVYVMQRRDKIIYNRAKRAMKQDDAKGDW